MAVTQNLFDGQNGNSDGTSNGSSRGLALTNIDGQSITTLNGPATISLTVGGSFDGASVELQKYYGGNWITFSDATWTNPRELQGLEMKVGTAYRLIISNSGAGTNIDAWGTY